MTRLSRDLLAKAFPDNPMLIGELEELDQFLSDAREEVATLLASAEDASNRLASLEETGKQPFSDLLTAISELPDDAGVIELVGSGQVNVRGVDALDDASLVSRGAAISFAGKGVTSSRPTLTAMTRAIYFDTTLASAGKPVFWTGSAWVDSSGATA